MNSFIQDALRTESSNFFCETLEEKRLLHAGMGFVTEAGEFMDALKKRIFYGKTLDRVNLKEEVGDMLWYMAVALDVLGSDFQAEMDRVIAKLKVRYPEKFAEHEAEYRNLMAEREVLEA